MYKGPGARKRASIQGRASAGLEGLRGQWGLRSSGAGAQVGARLVRVLSAIVKP